ncbi:MAG: glycoside hydrolase family 78 protein, partial [Clostridiales bacterium]|nr:glycoside hydrolase family 78 protein [Clostridiales bacterium]
INGTKIGDRILDPGQTDYEARIFYVTYDITENINEGKNCFGIMLGDGWYHQSRVWVNPNDMTNLCYGDPMAIMRVEIQYEDGSAELLVTDGSWKVRRGAIVQNNVYAGETCDARLEMPDWCKPGFIDTDWQAAEVVLGPEGKLTAQLMPPIKEFETVKPIKITTAIDGVYLFDFGINMAAIPKLKVKGVPGTEITIRFAEHCENGRIHTKSCGTFATRVIQTVRYICGGGENEYEEYKTHFTYLGFRYAEIEGLIYDPDEDTLNAVRVHTDAPEIFDFECSYENINKLHWLMKNTVLSNIHSIPTDCPVREKCGWTGDAWAMADIMMHNFDMVNFFRKYTEDMATTKQISGQIMNIVPGKRQCLDAGPAWGTAQVMIPWFIYRQYNDIRILKDNFDAMADWVEHLKKMSNNYVISDLKYNLDDWCPPKEINMGVTSSHFATACFYLCASTMLDVAMILGDNELIFYYDHMQAEIFSAFNNTFFIESKNSYGTQAIDSFALYFGLVPEAKEKRVAKAIADSVVEHGCHVMVGHLGIKYIFFILNRFGYKDLIKQVLDCDTYPGLTNLLKKGATTIFESWESDGREASLSHPFKGGYDLWFIKDILGFRMDKTAPGFKHFIIKQDAPEFITSAKGHFDSPMGRVEISWERAKEEYLLAVTVPPNCVASIYLPAKKESKVNEASDMEGVGTIVREGSHFYLKATSGSYRFTVKL